MKQMHTGVGRLIQGGAQLCLRATVRRGHWHARLSHDMKNYKQTVDFGRKLDAMRAEDLQRLFKAMPTAAKTKVVAALSGSLGAEERMQAERAFASMDLNKDGVICQKEFAAWHSSVNAAASVEAPTARQLMVLGMRHAVPMIGFGFADNFIMIMAGESIDSVIGTSFRLSTMAAAGLGNLCSDVVGLGLSNTIEAMASKIGIPESGLSPEQLVLPQCRRVMALASILGITIGCLIGMAPLAMFEPNRKELGKVFQLMDLNKDDKVTCSEITKSHQRLPFQVTQAALEEFLHSKGYADDDAVDFDDFCALMNDLERQLP
ncbi:transmembrane protein 65 [Salpingoeca rosetta]|uniref:Transmembrane protein 65 n=1 Tax=Salpingoeca rosetta (strain ATCC 50818 / BSB-021) TaxID=946362 RepID=F2U1U5_SALR5|nr:transmembrane protein 65 [Salpingoeca rosetta]EGD81597.1 transmembrane protein 65 [Salpingoeca rosetta]|eukprot:XP_004996801.1 transmembrane protein 65 [Salpingoeca rosetta]